MAWPGLVWPGLAWPGLVWPSFPSADHQSLLTSDALVDEELVAGAAVQPRNDLAFQDLGRQPRDGDHARVGRLHSSPGEPDRPFLPLGPADSPRVWP